MRSPHPYPLCERVAREIRAEMVRQEITAAQIAEALGISEATTFRRLSGQLPITVEELGRAAKLLRTTPADLLIRAEPMAEAV